MTGLSKNNQSLLEASKQRAFDGEHKQFTHFSETLNCEMRFAIYLPPKIQHKKAPVLYWLSGLTCTDENFMQKAGAFKKAAELGIVIVAPDTSPRGESIPDDPKGGYDLGLGAGFYVNATQEPWSHHYKMYDYIVNELPLLIETNFPVSNKRSISGHSMGGHGALMISLKNPQRFESASAFSPIANPMDCPWGRKAFHAYLGNIQEAWQAYDSSYLMKLATQASQQVPSLVDQGTADSFLEEQLKPDTLEQASTESNYPLVLNKREGYDHSYFFIASFIEEHLTFHAQFLIDESDH